MKWKDWDNEVANEWDEETFLEKIAGADEESVTAASVKMQSLPTINVFLFSCYR